MSDPQDSCVDPAAGPIAPEGNAPGAAAPAVAAPAPPKVMVGGPAPDFEASAYLDGGFKNIRLSSFKGKWVVLCFYPGDFTFV